VRSIYFDYNATTPLDPKVREAMLPFLGEVFGNPSSVHHIGRKARASLDESRERTAHILCCKPAEIIFTSGGTESNNLAIFGAARLLRDKGRHLITSTVEHHAVLHCFEYLQKKEGYEVTWLPVDNEGRISPNDLRKAIRKDTTLVSIMAANNETGTLQAVAELGALSKEKGVLFHTDAVQWFGKEKFTSVHQFNADLVSVCSHKFHGPKGAGALFLKSPLFPDPILFGGAHENERRAGTENLAGIVGFVEALELFVKEPVFSHATLFPLSAALSSALSRFEGVQVRGSSTQRLSNTISFTVSATDSVALLAALDLHGICASSGSACSSGSLNPSHVLLAMGVKPELANSFVRFSLGRHSTAEEVSFVIDRLPDVIKSVRST
jgi:cysteine desulfurase